jgi:hypothetical protein
MIAAPPLFELQGLEQRIFLSHSPLAAPFHVGTLPANFEYAPLGVVTTMPSAVVSKALRQDLLSHWNGSNKSTLQSLLNQGKYGAFDNNLLNYMRSRSSPDFFFDPTDLSSYVTYINSNLPTSGTISNADNIVNHLFPDQYGGDYTIQLPAGDINWLSQSATSSVPDFLHTLNRMESWIDLGNAFALTSDTKYLDEIKNELASWTKQNPPLADPNSWAANDPKWWLLDTSTRAEMWVWTYFTVMGSTDWDGASNTLFLDTLYKHADFLNRVTPVALTDNRAISHGKALQFIGEMFPEFTGGSSMATKGRNLLFDAMDTQFYADGSHYEQSPTYASGVIEDLLEAKALDAKNGVSWDSAHNTRLTNAIDSYWQILSPDGKRPAIGDAYRTTSVTLFLKADLVQGVTTWPAAKPRIKDVWIFGPSGVNPYIGNSSNPAIGDRGDTWADTDGGYYIARSGSDSNARQVIFDAGPFGGNHGHYDLLNFELFGYGKPLIADPGVYKYGTSSDRTYAISARAHNTINVDGQNMGQLEGAGNPGIHVTQWDVDSDHAQITASHDGYMYLDGAPVVSRSMWYDLDGTMVIVDWAESSSTHTYSQSFNLVGDSTQVAPAQADGSFYTRYSSGGNVKVAPVPRAGQSVSRSLTFVTSTPTGDYKDTAYRYSVSQTGTFAVFVTLITTYNGLTAPDTTATLLTTSPAPGRTVNVQLTKGGVDQTLSFTPPGVTRLNSTAMNSGSYNDIAYDKQGRLHMAYYDRPTRHLMYAVRGTNGKWSPAQVIDDGEDTGLFPSIAVDSKGRPGIAYFNAWDGNGMYAGMDANSHSWHISTVESKGSTGLYPSLAFSRGDGPVISYYNRSRGVLRLASSASNGGWDYRDVDTSADVGRGSSLVLDPARPTASKWAIAYEDSTHGTFKYAIQFNDTWKYSVIDASTIAGGGYTSMAFDPNTNLPGVSYYDAANSAVKFSQYDGKVWTNKTIASQQVQGLYTQSYFNSAGKATIFFFDKTHNLMKRASGTVYSKWSVADMEAGGREIHLSISPDGHIAYTNLDEHLGYMDVTIL